MDTIGEQKLWSFRGGKAQPASCSEIRKSEAVPVQDYLDLATKVAELQFRNREHALLFRGQRADYRNQSGYSSLKPSILRPGARRNPSQTELIERFDQLRQAEECLVRDYKESGLLGIERVVRQKILRWSIIQHYEICETPLLDVTHSLRIAASFASEGADDEAYLFILGVPQLSGAVSASAEAGLQIVRLSSACPPSALRPHLQEGYLLREYPELLAFDQKQHYEHHEVDFGRRLVAKFCLNPRTFWKKSGGFPKVPKNALYPNDKDDKLEQICAEIRNNISKN